MSFAGASLLRMYTAPTAHSRYLQAHDGDRLRLLQSRVAHRTPPPPRTAGTWQYVPRVLNQHGHRQHSHFDQAGMCVGGRLPCSIASCHQQLCTEQLRSCLGHGLQILWRLGMRCHAGRWSGWQECVRTALASNELSMPRALRVVTHRRGSTLPAHCTRSYNSPSTRPLAACSPIQDCSSARWSNTCKYAYKCESSCASFFHQLLDLHKKLTCRHVQNHAHIAVRRAPCAVQSYVPRSCAVPCRQGVAKIAVPWQLQRPCTGSRGAGSRGCAVHHLHVQLKVLLWGQE